ncbi:MAG: hypothetical protein IPM25_09045 [Chloracidobacterium sp.]|nr:hypothetical protein [Chloracidobacterium sp.]
MSRRFVQAVSWKTDDLFGCIRSLYRYLEGDQKFGKYQWITADITKDHRDSRPESHRLDKDSIEVGEKIKSTSDEWGLRAEYILKYPGWQFDSMEDLSSAQAKDGTSLGILIPKEIIKITEKIRPDEDRIAFEKKFDDLRVENEARRTGEIIRRLSRSGI